MLLLLYTMGCGRSRTASSVNKDKDDEKNLSVQQNNKSINNKLEKDSKKEIVDTKKRKDSAQTKIPDRKPCEIKYTENVTPPKASHNNINGSTVYEISENTDTGDNTENTGSSPTKTIRDKPSPPSSMMLQAKMSSSQLEFFKMLDEKIEMGRDYTTEEGKRSLSLL